MVLGLSVLLLALHYWDISLAHSVECWILNLEAPGSIPAHTSLTIGERGGAGFSKNGGKY